MATIKQIFSIKSFYSFLVLGLMIPFTLTIDKEGPKEANEEKTAL